jgi:hypothetical protein
VFMISLFVDRNIYSLLYTFRPTNHHTCTIISQGYFAPKQQSTIGAFFLTKKMVLADGTNCKMQLWDTAGQERFRAMAPVSLLAYLFIYIYLFLCVRHVVTVLNCNIL